MAVRELSEHMTVRFTKVLQLDPGGGQLTLRAGVGWTEATATPQVEVALRHLKCTLIANALGTPPADMIR